MKVLILGGGRQGRVIAGDLAAHADVTVADLRKPDIKGVGTKEANLADFDTLVRLMGEYELAVGALPARLGFQAARAAVEAGRNYVDIAFYAENVGTLHEDAKSAGIAVVPDCGVAPGISNLVVGRAVAEGLPDEVHIKVGGFAQERNRPFGYVITWSVEDLLDEYTRPARIRTSGRIVTVPALSGVENLRVEGVGELEAFFTDGLRTLLNFEIREMTEKTLRWPGHVSQVRPLLPNNALEAELRAKCAEGDDIVVLVIDIVRGRKRERLFLVDRPQDGLTAMSRTTAFTCAAVARWVITGGLKETGVVAPEKIGTDARAYDFIMAALREHDITVA